MSLPVPVQEEIKRGVSERVKGLILGKIIEGAVTLLSKELMINNDHDDK
jgi:hypothetical protein